MKKTILVITLLLCSFTAFPQYITSGAKFNPPSTSELALFSALMMEAKNQRAYRESEAKKNALGTIDGLIKYITNILGQNIDKTLRKQLNEDYELLNEIASNIRRNGLRTDLIDELQWVYDDINDNIVSYNNRLAEANRKNEEAQRETSAEPQVWFGTGFALNNGYVVTNYHVVEDANAIYISGINGDYDAYYTASVVASDRTNDLAIVKIRDKSFKGFGILPYSINMKMAEVGEDIFVLGYPLIQTMGTEIKLTNGIISSRTGFQGDVSLYQITAPLQPGNSGGPMFDSKGNVIGIIFANHTGTENVGYAIKSSYLKNLAESASLTNIFPKNNTISSLPLSGKIKKLKRFVYLISCISGDINEVVEEVAEVVEEVEEEKEVNPTLSIHEKTIKNPSVFLKRTNDLTVTCVTMTNYYTSIELRSKYTGYPWCNIDSNTYISINDTMYILSRADMINISPTKTYYHDKDITFTLYFPPIPLTTKEIDLIEPGGSDWKIYGIKLQ